MTFGENGVVLGSVSRQKICLLHTHHSIQNTVGQSIASTYDLGSIFILGLDWL